MKKITGMIIISCVMLILAVAFNGCKVKTSVKENEKQEITVFAASSLTESMEEIVKQFEKENPNLKVNLHLAGSSKLRVQIEQGVEVDLFISANQKHYDILKDKDFTLEGKHFLSNSMAVIVPKNNPAQIKTLKDIEKTCKLVVAQKEVPAGYYARQIIHSLAGELGGNYEQKVLANIVSEETNIKQVVNKVVIGEADAAFVYTSDIIENIKDKVNILDIPLEHNVKAAYWIAQLKQSKDNKYAKQFYEFLLSEQGQVILEKYGFETIGLIRNF